MASFSLAIKRSAAKELEGVEPLTLRRRLVARLRALADEPRPAGAEKLEGGANRYRLRQGALRILYESDDRARRVEIAKVGHRREVYR